ncbi:ATP-dependent acyl-CoA ligase [Paracoccus xiamenensis]|uniref:ATP-dependent acyl-CoA ligase n=1 Tax=Paracoccus xiamenensis TaxID=2714901 RepID=UPI00140AA55D|nr:ATP-dependent acyl-CoA ligase [Paracoccus xiamenensis]NHF72858.1 ATP-dependent acyl-CoA ligase [Paracoccus xiamenensis]
MTEIAAFKSAFPPAERVLPKLLLAQEARFSDAPLFACGEAKLTYRQTRRAAAQAAAALEAGGIAQGDRVAIICGNRPEFMPVFLGCGWMGAVSVPINTASRGFQLQHILSNSGAKLLVIEDSLLEVLEGLELDKLAIQRIWVIGEGALPDLPGISVEHLPQTDTEATAAAVKPSDALTILYTSGTTGLSKGVVCPHAQFFWWGVYTGHMLGLRTGDVLHTPLPLFHTNALNCFFQALLNGCQQVVEQKFSVSGFWGAMGASGATVTYVLGAMVPMLLSRPEGADEKAHTVRVALAPGVPAPAAEEFTRRTGVVLLDAYGATESNVVIGTTESTLKPGWTGLLLPGFDARIVDEADNPVPDGEAGELVIRADEPFAMSLGYFGMPEKTAEAWQNLWLHTGDRMLRAPDGYFRFLDRMKDSIRRRGENISSYEVEQVLAAHPDVAEVVVFPVASELAEDEVMTAIILHDGAAPDPEAIIRHCEGKMSYFAVPRYVEFMAELPKTANGKVQKFILRERGVTDATWDREAAGVTVRR